MWRTITNSTLKEYLLPLWVLLFLLWWCPKMRCLWSNLILSNTHRMFEPVCLQDILKWTFGFVNDCKDSEVISMIKKKKSQAPEDRKTFEARSMCLGSGIYLEWLWDSERKALRQSLERFPRSKVRQGKGETKGRSPFRVTSAWSPCTDVSHISELPRLASRKL